MARMIDDGGLNGSATPKITANPAAKLTYDSPAVSTYSPSGGWTAPAGNVQPYSNMPAVGSQQTYAPATKNWVSPGPTASQEPPASAGPAVGGSQWYNSLGADQQAQTQNSFLGGDADYTAQLGEYDRALNDFIARIQAQKDNFELDERNALGATDRNEQYAGNQLGEDFGARGMSYSGLFDKSKNEMGERFKEQKSNISQVRARNDQDATNRQADYQAENNIGRSNAKRSALTRMAAQQAMIDSNAGL